MALDDLKQKTEKLNLANGEVLSLKSDRSLGVARKALEAGQWKVALAIIDMGLRANGNQWEMHELRALVAQIQLDFKAADAAWKRVHELHSKHPHAATNSALAAKLTAFPWKPADLEAVRAAMVTQARKAEAKALMQQAGTALMKHYKLTGELTSDGDGFLSLTLPPGPLPELRHIVDLPLVGLTLDGTEIRDLRPLATSGIAFLSLRGCLKVNDLKPLKDCQRLRELHLVGCDNLKDLTSLSEHKTLVVLELPATLGRDALKVLKTKLPKSIESIGQPLSGKLAAEMKRPEEFWKILDGGSGAQEALDKLIAGPVVEKKSLPEKGGAVKSSPENEAAAKRLVEKEDAAKKAMQAFLVELIKKYGREVDDKPELAAAVAYVHGPKLPALFPHPLVPRSSFRRNTDRLAIFAYFANPDRYKKVEAQKADALIHAVDFFGEIADLEAAESLANGELGRGGSPLSFLALFPDSLRKDQTLLILEDMWPEAKGRYTPKALNDSPQLERRKGGAFAHRAYGACTLLKSVGIPCYPVYVQSYAKDTYTAWIRVFWSGKWEFFGERTITGKEITATTKDEERFENWVIQEPGMWRWVSEKASWSRRSKPNPYNALSYPFLAILERADEVFQTCDDAISTKDPRTWKKARSQCEEVFRYSNTLSGSQDFFKFFVALSFARDLHDHGSPEEARRFIQGLLYSSDKAYADIMERKRGLPTKAALPARP